MTIDLVDIPNMRRVTIRESNLYPHNNSEASIFAWTEGNWSCDCNRKKYFDPSILSIYGIEICTSNRFVVVRVDPMPKGYTLDDFNSDYETAIQLFAQEFIKFTQEEIERYKTYFK